MKRLRNLSIALLIPVAGVALLIALSSLPLGFAGKWMAQQDIAHGRFVVATALPATMITSSLRNEMLTKYGVTLLPSRGCLKTAAESTYESGYNLVMREALQKKFDLDIAKEVRKRAQEDALARLARQVK